MTRIFRFDTEKAIQAVAYLLRREVGHRMNYMRLLKVLYIAERETLREAGTSITGSLVIAMERGPVLEEIYQLIRGFHIDSPIWAKHLRRDRTHLELNDRNDPGMSRLSKFIIEKLEKVATDHEGDDEWAMVEFTHEFPEWKKNNPGKSSRPIPLIDILQAVGCESDFDDIVECAAKETRAYNTFRECQLGSN